MITATKTVTINAAFLQEIKEDNLRLYELLDELHALCAADQPTFVEPERFSELLDELRDQLAMHFALEEALGYLDNPLEVHPTVCEDAERLRSQHVDLYLEIVAIADGAATALYPKLRGPAWPTIVNRFRLFQNVLRRHEADESELIWMVYLRDVGGEA